MRFALIAKSSTNTYVWGAADLLFAFWQALFGVRLDPRMLGAAFFIPTVVVPPLLITHGLVFWLLFRPKQ
jgi:hypothetical protein